MSIEILIENDNKNECIICFDNINDDNPNVQIFKDCDHNNDFHNECINDWIKESIKNKIIPACPICRKQMKITEITIYIPDEIIRTQQNIQTSEYITRYNYINLFNCYSLIRYRNFHIFGCIALLIGLSIFTINNN